MDPLVEATSGHMAIIRLLGPTSIDTGAQKTRRSNSGRKTGSRAKKLSKFLPVNEYFRPISIAHDQWKAVWVETRNGLNTEDLPHTFRDATARRHERRHPLDGIILSGALPDSVGDIWKRQSLEEPQGIEGCCHQDVQDTRVAGCKKQRAGSDD